jgi:hypothetical protein
MLSLISTQKLTMADQLSVVEAEKEELLNQLEEESSRQEKVGILRSCGAG